MDLQFQAHPDWVFCLFLFFCLASVPGDSSLLILLTQTMSHPLAFTRSRAQVRLWIVSLETSGPIPNYIPQELRRTPRYLLGKSFESFGPLRFSRANRRG